jgi:hypothetical protein
MLDIIAEFLIDAIGDLFESGAETAAEAAADAATDVGVDATLGAGVDVLDPGAALAPPVDSAVSGGGTPFVFDNHPISATLRSAGFSGQV